MNTSPTIIQRCIDSHEFEEMPGLLRLIDVLDKAGNISPTEAAEWRRRIAARMQFQELGHEQVDMDETE